MYLRLFLFFLIFFHAAHTYSQDSLASEEYPYSFRFCIYDYPSDIQAFKISKSSIAGKLFKPFELPGMFRALEFSTSVYTLAHLKISQIEFKNNTFLTRLIANTALSLTDILLLYVPGGSAWLHEEYHRAVLAKNSANSFNGINRIPLFSGLVSVDHVSDDDLANIKNNNNADFVRLSAAGIEGELLLTRQLQINNFFNNYQLPNLFIYWFSALNSRSYISLCSKPYADELTDQISQSEGTNIDVRDFTGLDFTAWAYDLANPNEAYQQRGAHPSGIGIDRYIRYSDLSQQSVRYLKKQSYLSYLNLFSPAFIGLDQIYLIMGKKRQKIAFNFAFGHLLTSFGNDISCHLFMRKEKLNLLLGYHHFSNFNRSFPGIEIQSFNNTLKINGKELSLNPFVMFWLQPENFDFLTNKSMSGALTGFSLSTKFSKRVQGIMSVEAKTKGWVAGNVYQEKNLSVRVSVSYNFH